jgi:hypothetical protein
MDQRAILDHQFTVAAYAFNWATWPGSACAGARKSVPTRVPAAFRANGSAAIQSAWNQLFVQGRLHVASQSAFCHAQSVLRNTTKGLQASHKLLGNRCLSGILVFSNPVDDSYVDGMQADPQGELL